MPTRSSSTPSLSNAGSVISTTRTMKEWEGAGNAGRRRSRCDSRKRTRAKQMSGCSSEPSLGLFQDTTPVVMARGPMAPRLVGEGDLQFDGWLKNRAEVIFKQLDRKNTGFLDLDDLRTSFTELHMKDPTLRMDDRTFGLYCGNLFPKHCDLIDMPQYIMFHRAVWENQPLPVRRSHSNLRGIHDAETLARSAFTKYDRDQSGFLDANELPQVLEDLGFVLDDSEAKIQAFLKKQFKRADKNKDGKITYHEFVDFQNNFIETKEVAEGVRSKFADEFKGGFKFRT
eukprot:gnl/TRDRNA2_/TRDRNA2_198651_c0_seq1.p1 gnl/TRDRNA2_/TRDRNA2_198651_c0~~gnl/TRDRNA2_/TRDRNA2_198651_c0_seq1.p1  ORF type:complete len:285 (+),score=50.62 gnl/TRDRNA2_/TRDRNA2_198651_c0_seq1:103-957(+)